MGLLNSFFMWVSPILLIHIISIIVTPFSVDFATKIIILLMNASKRSNGLNDLNS
jgi:hypothetical protein